MLSSLGQSLCSAAVAVARLFYPSNYHWSEVHTDSTCYFTPPGATYSVYFAVAMGFLRIRITESPRRNILEMYLSLFTGLDFFFPLPVLGTSVHISFTFSKTILQCLQRNFTIVKSHNVTSDSLDIHIIITQNT